MNRELKLLLLDFDGTLADTRRANTLAYVETLREAGYDLTEEEYAARYFGMRCDRFLTQLGIADPSERERLRLRKIARYPAFFDTVRLNEPLWAFCRQFQAGGGRVWIVSTGSLDNISNVMRHLGIGGPLPTAHATDAAAPQVAPFAGTGVSATPGRHFSGSGPAAARCCAASATAPPDPTNTSSSPDLANPAPSLDLANPAPPQRLATPAPPLGPANPASSPCLANPAPSLNLADAAPPQRLATPTTLLGPASPASSPGLANPAPLPDAAPPQRLVTPAPPLGRVDGIISGADVIHPKPAPDCFLEAMRREGCSPDETLIFEDSEIGLEAARRSGAAYIRITL